MKFNTLNIKENNNVPDTSSESFLEALEGVIGFPFWNVIGQN